ncbi:MAG: hypothetical protein H0T52_09755, partial [Lautropia sp.]|nr:hypothetical protein [Lautropia sp.]
MADVGTLADLLRARFADAGDSGIDVLDISPDLHAPDLAPSIGGPAASLSPPRDCITLLVAADAWVATAHALRDDFGFEQMVD